MGYLPATQEFWFLDPPPSIFANFTTFLECVAHWVEEQSSSTHSGLACKAVHGANRVWLGVGVYTVAELFFMAGKYCDPVNGPCTGIFLMLLMTGLSPFLIEAEVFDNPLRMARLCVAFFVFASHAHINIW